MRSASVATPSADGELVRPLDPESLELFAAKGLQADAGHARPKGLATNGNGVRVRRVIQLTRDLACCPFDELRILDHACGDGVFAIEAGLRGADVVGIDARRERLDGGGAAVRRLGLTNVHFEQGDIRTVNRVTHGEFDVIYCLGILYHLDVPDVFDVVQTLHDMCRRFVIIDTETAPHASATAEYAGRTYFGVFGKEHDPEDSDDVRRARVKASIDNHRSFVLTRPSLVRLLHDAGFGSVNLCLAPFEPDKTAHRVTLVAHKGERVKLSTYPWVNGRSEEEIARSMGAIAPPEALPAAARPSVAGRLRAGANKVLRPFGVELRRLRA